MGKIIELASYTEEYNSITKEIIKELENFEVYLFDSSLEILLSAKWRKWSEDLPIGTIFNFRKKEMLEADDLEVNELLELRALLKEEREKILINTVSQS